jgi:2-polyprenyl-6-methoxyphenol hydroxylase-like FAD-dependent oxidoreductase
VNNNPTYHDAIVVGARAAGAATAMLLASAGLSVIVVERGRYGTDTLSTHALMRGGVLQLHRWGLLDRIASAGTPAVRRTRFHYAGEHREVAIKAADGVEALYAPRRTVLDPVLVDAALDAGAEVRYGITVADIEVSRHGRVIGINGRDASGQRFAARGRFVIGADGLHSTIARRVDAPVTRSGMAAGAYLYGYWANLGTDAYEWAYRAGTAAGFIPTNDGLTCVFVGASPGRVRRGDRDLLQSIVGDASPAMAAQLRAGVPPRLVRRFAGPPAYLRRPWGPGWALVGDAAYWKDPISAHGLTDALRDAELLARALTAALAGGTTERDALSRYQAERDRLSIPMLSMSDRVATYAWDDEEIGTLLRQLASTMADEVDALASLERAPRLTARLGAAS